MIQNLQGKKGPGDESIKEFNASRPQKELMEWNEELGPSPFFELARAEDQMNRINTKDDYAGSTPEVPGGRDPDVSGS